MRPAWYALAPGGWRDYVTLLHPPYTAWHLSYVVVGGCLAPVVSWGRLGLAVLAFALAMGVGAHALDELNGRPLGTAIPRRVLIALALVSVAAACAIGIAVALAFDPLLLVFVAAGAFIVPAYNLELLGGRFHSDLWFALAWGAFPVLTGYAACAGDIGLAAVAAAAWAAALSLAQRRLSTPVRRMRRQVRVRDRRARAGRRIARAARRRCAHWPRPRRPYGCSPSPPSPPRLPSCWRASRVSAGWCGFSPSASSSGSLVSVLLALALRRARARARATDELVAEARTAAARGRRAGDGDARRGDSPHARP